MGRDNVVGLHRLDVGHRVLDDLGSCIDQMESAHHRVDLLQSRHLLRLFDRIDDSGMRTAGDVHRRPRWQGVLEVQREVATAEFCHAFRLDTRTRLTSGD